MFTVTSDLSHSRRLIGRLNQIQRQSAQAALLRSAQSTRAEAVKQIRKVYAFKARDVRTALSLNKNGFGRLEISIDSKSGRTPLINLRVGRSSRRASFRVTRGSGVSRIRGSFIATMKSGHTGIFTRHPTKTMRNKKKAAIVERFTIAVSEAFASRTSTAVLLKVSEDVFNKRYQHELARRMKSTAPSVTFGSVPPPI